MIRIADDEDLLLEDPDRTDEDDWTTSIDWMHGSHAHGLEAVAEAES